MMDRVDFLRELEAGLAGVSPDEKAAAMQYYTEYFDDAGPEREAEALAELGSPAKIAADVRVQGGTGDSWAPPARGDAFAAGRKAAQAAMAKAESELTPDKTEDPINSETREFFDKPTPKSPHGKAPLPVIYQTADAEEEKQQEPAGPQASTPPPPPPNGGHPYNGQGAAGGTSYSNNGLRTALLIVAAIFLFPILAGLFGVLIGLLASAVVLFLCPIIVGVAFVASGAAVFILGIALMPFSPGNGLVNLGIGIALFALGLLAFRFGGWLLGKVLPAAVRGVTGFISGLFHGRKGRSQA